MTYDSKIFFINHIKGYINLIRPFTLLAPIIVSISIMISSFYYSGNVNISSVFWNMIIPSSLCLAILNAASNSLNQASDVKSDKISKSYRPIPLGLVSIKEACVLSLILYILAIYISTSINLFFTLYVVLISIFTITYSIPPRMKNYLFFNQLWVAIPRGFLGILASWSVFNHNLSVLPLTIGFISLLFLIGGSITKDIIDKDADKKNGTNTLINTFGIKKAAMISFPFLFFPFILVLILIDIGIIETYLWSLTFFSIPGYFIFYSIIRDNSKSKFFENTSSWSLMYITYFLFAISFSILTVTNSIL
jgi:4-hydroxybenzoate polyprenyltransferase